MEAEMGEMGQMGDEGWRDAQVEAEIRCDAKDAHIHAQDEGLYESGNIFSWAICRFLDDEEQININWKYHEFDVREIHQGHLTSGLPAAGSPALL